ncbi:MAG: hypothetical protein DWQ02_25315 [Bacteroidetes bacterium]|nr:MAG: hypothetical protein DWQ02_25315 [Bacteroidota bacterium]
MANHYNNDDLEGFFRRRMSNYEETPRPEMWDRIGAAIPPKPAVALWKKPVFWLGVVLAFILLLSVWQYLQIRQFRHIIDRQQADIEALKNVQTPSYGPDQTGFSPVESSNFFANTPEDKKPVNESTTFVSKPGITTIKPDIVLTENPKTSNTQEETTSLDIIPSIEKAIAGNSTEASLVSLNKPAKIHPAVSYLNQSNPQNLIIPSPPLPAPSQIEPVKQKARFYFSVAGGSLVTTYNNPLNKSRSEVLASNESGFHLSNTVRDELSILAGIQFNNNWSLETGIGYRNNRLSLFDAQQFYYSGEHTIAHDEYGNPIGEYTNTTDQTPVFRYEIINNADIEDGEAFHLNAFFKYNNRYLSLPLWLKYRIGKRKLHVYAKSGIAWNILTVSNKNLNDSNLSDDRLSIEKVQIKNDALNESFVELGFATGIEYDIGLRTSLSMEALYYHSVASVLTTKQDAYGISFAARYHF